LVIHAFIVAGVSSFGFVFALMSIGSSSQALLYAAVIASGFVAAGFAVQLAAIFRERSPASAAASPTRAGNTPKADWRIGCLAAWLVISLAAAISELLGGGWPDARRSVSTLGYACLIALFAWQAFRVARTEQQLHSS
jgi:hypothetical protein